MTKVEYERLTRKVRVQTTREWRTAMTQVRKIYLKSADEIAKKISELPTESFALEISSNVKLIQALEQSSEDIANALNDNILSSIQTTASRVSKVNQDYLLNVGLDNVQLRNIFVSVNDALVKETVSRVYQDGYTFSQRIWKTGQTFQTDIKNVLSAGISQTRDPFEIAKDIQTYVADGKPKLMKRYGRLIKGTDDFTKRIPENIDYRAVRLVRSEIYTSLRESEVRSGEANPACTGLYRWIMDPSRAHWDCACPTYSAGGPYTAENVPSSPHPNCSCYIQAVLMDRNEFVNDLVNWKNGANIGYLDDWSNKYGYVA